MNAAIDQLQLWTTQNLLRRADQVNEGLGATGWLGPLPVTAVTGGSTDSSVRGGDPVIDEWQVMEQQGFYQEPDTGELRLMPVLVYPGIVLMPWLERPMVPQPQQILWVEIRYWVAGTTFQHPPGKDGPVKSTTGWDGVISHASAKLIWAPWDRDLLDGAVRMHIGYQGELPPGGVFVWYGMIGGTDAAGNYGTTGYQGSYLQNVCGQWVPPFTISA